MNKLQEDILAVDRLAIVLAEAQMHQGLYKKADLTSTLSSLANSIYNKVSQQIDTSSTGSIIKSILKFLEPGVIFMLGGPLLAAVDAAAQIILGWSVTDAVYWIVSKIKPMIMSGQPVAGTEVDAAAAEFAQQQGGEEIGALASNDLLKDLRMIHRQGKITKEAVWPFGSRGRRAADPLAKLFAQLGMRRASFLGAGIVGLIIKIVLISGGLLIGGGMIADWLGISKKPATPTAEVSSQSTETTPITSTIPASQTVTVQQQDLVALKSSGAGEITHPNTDSNTWFVPLVGGDLVETLMSWVREIYPQFSEYDRIIVEMPSFRRVYDQFKTKYNPDNPGWVAVPPQYKRRIDVVKPIVTETYSHLKSQL